MAEGTYLSWGVFLAVIAIGILGYYIGKSVGYEEGFDAGMVKGHREGQKKWIQAMEARRGPDGKDALVRVFDTTISTSSTPPLQGPGGSWA